MKVGIIGSGGREHALLRAVAKNPIIKEIYAIPGNGGMADEAVCLSIDIKNIDEVLAVCLDKDLDYVIVAPDDPLAAGLVNLLEDNGIACFGPRKEAAIIEASKVFSKDLMKKYNIPTAFYENFDNANKAKEYLENSEYPIVIKADGLALGKGVIIANSKEEAYNAIDEIMLDHKFGASGNKVVIEEFLEGVEVSVLSFTDGKTVLPMISSMDHKKAYDNDEGLNTGGMGVIAPNPYYTESIATECMEKIFKPTIEAMRLENRTFKGCLYFGLILTKDGPKVIEYNARFGDPETQCILPLLKTDLFEIMLATSSGDLDKIKLEWDNKASCLVVLASEGYPLEYKSGYEIKIDTNKESVYVAGAKLVAGKLLSAGGRVLGVVGLGDDLKGAIDEAYKKVEKVSFQNKFYRTDIGKKALEVKN